MEKVGWLTGSLLALLILLPMALFGGKHELALPVTSVLIVLLVILRNKTTLDEHRLKTSGWWLVAFLGWIIINTWLFSTSSYVSFIASLPIFSGAIIFLIIQIFEPQIETMDTFRRACLLGAGTIILIGLYIYLSPRFPSMRMGGLLRQHNAYAGFLIALLPLSLFATVFEKRWKWVWTVTAILIVTALVLTFSRGGFIAAALALIIFWVLAHQRRVLAVSLLIIILGGSLAYGLYQIKTINFNAVTIIPLSSPYAGEVPEQGETGVNSRLRYWRDALKIVATRPIVGTGLNTFEQEYRRVQTDSRFFTIDPHNLTLKIWVELGLVGVIIFVGFLISLVAWLWRYGPARQFNPAMPAALIGLLAHYSLDLDLTFPAHYLLFFTLAALTQTKT